MYCGGIVASCTSLISEEIASSYGTIYNLLAICYRVLGRKIYYEFKAAEFNVGRAHLSVSASKTMLKAVNGMMGFLSAGEETNNVGGVNSERE